MLTGKKEYSQFITVIFLFTITGFILYYPVLGNTFLSDDYDSLYRIYIEKRILYRDFLRPMIDISFYFNYFISGLSPGSFYVFNVVLHIINALLLFRFTLTLQMVGEKDQFWFALVSSSLFLIYPFHNESISWLSGRLSSMACFFALLSLLLSVKNKGRLFIFLSIGSYLLGLLCYESIILLPVIIMALNWRHYTSKQKIISYSFCWITATGIYFVARYFLSGVITGNYGNGLADDNFKQKLLNIGKVTGRLFLPPSENQQLLTTLTILLFILLVALHIWIFYNKIFKDIARTGYLVILTSLVISLFIPFAFSISTRTSESDRLLYFPSCFFCILAGSWLMVLCKKSLSRLLVSVTIIFYCVWFLEINNQHWVRASDAAKAIMNACKNKERQNVVFINMPDEIEGAFVFRNGFRKALIINRIDTSSVMVFNYLKRPDYVKTVNIIIPAVKDSLLTIFPFTHVSVDSRNRVDITSTINNRTVTVEKERNLIYYWNKEKLVRLTDYGF